VIRSFALAAAVLLVSLPPAAAVAQDDLARQLINSCVGCRLPKDLHGRDLHGLRFVGADLRDVDFSHANLNGAEFTGAGLRGVKIVGANLNDAKLAGARLNDARLAGATVGDAILCADNRGGDDFAPRTVCADLRGADLHGVDLRAARHCSDDERSAARSCRPVTRAELTDLAHADLTGALAPA
jgi:uncharacterized protein YjbI with pentapeptide repeats